MKKTRFLSAAPAVVGRWLLTVFLFTGAVQGYSQSSAVDLQKNITIQAGEMPLDKLLQVVGLQTGARFSLNTRKFPPSRLIHLHKKTQPLGALLEDIQRQTGISYRLLGGHVIFVDAPPVKQTPAAATSKPVTAIVKKQAVSRKMPEAIRNNAQTVNRVTAPQTPVLAKDAVIASLQSPDSLVIRLDTLKVAMAVQKKDSVLYRPDSGLLNLSLKKSPEGQKEKSRDGIVNISFSRGEKKGYTGILPGPDTSVKKEAAPPLTAEAIRKQPAAGNPQQKTATATDATQQAGITTKHTRNSGNKREHSFFLTNWFRRSNSSFTGIRNAGDGPRPGLIPFISAGVTLEESYYINGQLQAGMPFLYAIASWGTGRGASGLRYGAGISVRMGEDWRIHFQATTGRMEFDYDSSTFVQKQIRMQWHKLALLGERRLNDHFAVQGGISLNILNTEYYSFKELMPLGRPEETALKGVQYFKPLYTISDNFSASEPKSRKMWIGIQLGVSYRLDFRRK